MEFLKDSSTPYSSYHYPGRFGEVLEPRRWMILLAVCLIWITSAIGFLTFNATSKTSMRYFHVTDENQILYFTDVNLYCSMILGYLGCWLAYKYFRISMILTALLTCLAAWIRYYAGDSYIIALLCQTLIGLAGISIFGFATLALLVRPYLKIGGLLVQISIIFGKERDAPELQIALVVNWIIKLDDNLGLETKISIGLIPDRWFSTKERFAVNTVTLFSNYIGWALGTMLPCIVMNDDETKMSENMLVQAYILTVPLIITIIFVKEKPKTPPSYSALVKTEDKGFIKEMRTLGKSKKWVGSSLAFGMVLGLSNSIPTTNSIFMDPLNLSYLQQGYITLGYVITGLITGFVGTVYIAKKGVKNCDFILKVLLSISFVSLLALGVVFVFVSKPNMLLILLCNCVLGIGFIGFMPFGCASIIESNFPVQESISTNGMNIAAMVFSIGASHLSIAGFVGKSGFLVLAALMFPCWVYTILFYETVYKKQEADEKHQDMVREIGDKASGLIVEEWRTETVITE